MTQPTDVTVLPAQVFTGVLKDALADNGGPTKTHALITRGLAIDQGNCPAEQADQRGFKRPIDDAGVANKGNGCDIGAYEAQGADLLVSQSVDKISIRQGDRLTYTVRVQNTGPEDAPNVVPTNLLSSGTTFVQARVNKGTVTAPPIGETGTVTWKLGTLADKANEAAEITVTVIVRGKTTITNVASATADAADPNVANNSASITVSVASGSSGGGGGKKP